MPGLISSFKKTNKILGIRDKIGAVLKPVSIVTRTWPGSKVGEGGDPTDVVVKLLPSPRIVDLSHDIRIQPGGNIKHGDLILKGVSKESYPTEGELDGSSSARNIEKLYLVGEKLYQPISITEKHLTWNIQVRALSYQERFD